MSKTQFKPGKMYYCRSICDYDCKWFYLVTRRTEKTIYVKEDGTGPEKALRVKDDRGEEYVMPDGRYSMAPVLTAGRMC